VTTDVKDLMETPLGKNYDLSVMELKNRMEVALEENNYEESSLRYEQLEELWEDELMPTDLRGDIDNFLCKVEPD
jgi:hypothetical protein